MKAPGDDTHSTRRHDKQLEGIALEAVLQKRRLDQALNAKEFAVCAGVSYSTARTWFHLPGFPVFHGVIFWSDFVRWRMEHNGLHRPPLPQGNSNASLTTSHLPPRAARILLDADSGQQRSRPQPYNACKSRSKDKPV